MDEGERLTYFTCTLDQAARWKKSVSGGRVTQSDTILDLIDEQARCFPDHPALGIADFSPRDSVDRGQ